MDFGEMTRHAQGNALLREPPVVQSRPHLAAAVWRVHRSQRPVFILGDVGVIARYSGATEPIHPLNGSGDLQALILPISSSALLVGAMATALPIEDDAVNVASAELSRDFFVAANDGPREADYHNALGHRATIIDDVTVDQWLREVFPRG